MSKIFTSVLSVTLLISNLYIGHCQNDENPNSDILGNISVVFIADEVRSGIISAMKECWNIIRKDSTSGGKTTEETESNFWNDTLGKNLKQFHEKVLEIDRMINDHAPFKVLDPIVNLTVLEDLQNATDFVEAKSSDVSWIDTVKVGWIRVQSLTSQIGWKYEWIINRIFENGLSNEIDIDLITNEKELLYFAWTPVEDRGEAPEKYHLNAKELPEFSKSILAGPEKPEEKHDLFYGLKALLDLKEGTPNGPDGDTGSNKSCIGNQTFAGVRPTNNNYLPVYVLLHLLNAEFKFYIIRNVANMYLCIHSKSCDYESSEKLDAHLEEYYDFYFGGIVRAFLSNVERSNQNDDDPKLWRWRCDPAEHVEDATYTRFIDFETGFVANEKDLSATQTCRDTCDSFDGGFSKIPCPQTDWSCLGQEGDFDCMDKVKHNLSCPDPAIKRICPHGIRCETTALETAKVCMANNAKRYIQWIDTMEYDSYLGKESSCESDSTIEMVTSEMTERSEISKYDPQKCEICLCKCFEPVLPENESHRYMSLLPAVTKVDEGYVLVGTRFVKIANVIYIQVAEAKLVDGGIDGSTVRWVDPEQVTNTSDASQVFRLGRESRKLLLDDLTVPEGHAITGLNFKSVEIPTYEDFERIIQDAKYSLDKSQAESFQWKFGFMHYELRLEAQVTKIDETGKLDASNFTWISNQNVSDSREGIILENVDVPSLSVEGSEPVVPNFRNMYVMVQSTSMKKDAGQTPVPFFDTQDLVETKGITPIQSIGLFLKGQPGFGGFVTFRFKSKSSSEFIPPLNYDLWRLIRRGLYSKYLKNNA